MAAYKEGMKLVLIPKGNESDLYEVDPEVKEHVVFQPVETLEEVLNTALLPLKKAKAPVKAKQRTEEKSAAPLPTKADSSSGAVHITQ